MVQLRTEMDTLGTCSFTLFIYSVRVTCYFANAVIQLELEHSMRDDT